MRNLCKLFKKRCPFVTNSQSREFIVRINLVFVLVTHNFRVDSENYFFSQRMQFSLSD